MFKAMPAVLAPKLAARKTPLGQFAPDRRASRVAEFLATLGVVDTISAGFGGQMERHGALICPPTALCTGLGDEYPPRNGLVIYRPKVDTPFFGWLRPRLSPGRAAFRQPQFRQALRQMSAEPYPR